MTNKEKEIIKKEFNRKLNLSLDFARAFGKIDFLADCDLGSETRNETIVKLYSQLKSIQNQVGDLLTEKECK